MHLKFRGLRKFLPIDLPISLEDFKPVNVQYSHERLFPIVTGLEGTIKLLDKPSEKSFVDCLC